MAELPRPTKLEIDPRFMLLLAGPTAVYLGTLYFLATYGDIDFRFPEFTLRADAAVHELVGRYKFYAALFFYGAVSIAVALYFVVDTGGRHTRRSLIWAGTGVVFILVLVMGFSVINPRVLGGVANWDLLGRNVFDATVATGHVTYCNDGSDTPGCVKRSAFGAMVDLLAVIDLLAALGASGVILGTIMTLAKPAPGFDLSTDLGRAKAARALHGARDASRRYVYCSGLMLSSGMTVLIAWMNWPAQMIAEEAARSAYVQLVGSVSLLVGVSYSLLILSYYMPVTLILARRIYEVRHDMTAERSSVSEDAAQSGLPALPELGQLDGLKAVIAIISPILASAVGSFGNGLLFE